MFRLRIVCLALGVVTSLGCAGSHRVALSGERTLAAGVAAWDDHVDHVIDDCRAKELPTPEQRAECVDEVKSLDADVVSPAVLAAGLALQAYWVGVAAKAKPAELARLLADFVAAVAALPPEYFGGLQSK